MLWLDLWSNWFLGNWSKMFEITGSMSDDALRRSDLFQVALMIGGFGRAAWLGTDRIDDVPQLQERCKDFTSHCKVANPFTVFDQLAQMQECIYQQRFSEGWRVYQQLDAGLREFPRGTVQLARVSALAVGTLLAIHMYAEEQDDDWLKRIRSMTGDLRRECIPFALMLADFYDGLMLLHLGQCVGTQQVMSECREAFQCARVQAQQQHLSPYVLAVDDGLAELEQGQSSDLLRDRMLQHGVANPDCFRRLYTVPLR